MINVINFTDDAFLKIGSAAAITQGVLYEDFIKLPREHQERIIRSCYEEGHWSVFEFADLDIEVTGVSRVFETQAVRSRMASFEIQSGRRDQEYQPCEYAERYPAVAEAIDEAIERYNTLVAMGIPPEVARFAQAQGVARSARIKRNFRNLMETSMIRLCAKTQHEYRLFMEEIKEQVAKVDPFLASFLVPECVVFGYCRQRKSCRRGGVFTKQEAFAILREAQARRDSSGN
jgi:thymidylate synthase ThyX